MINEVLPCPLCGAVVKVRNRRNERTWSEFLVSDSFYIKCKCGLKTKDYKKRTNLIKMWNRRAEVVVQGIQDMV